MFGGLPPWINLLLFPAGGAVVWFAGVRLEWLTDETSRRTKLGGAFAGLVLLAAVTSLPEIATVVTASVSGNPSLAVHNLLGAVAFQVVILVIADLTGKRRAISSFRPPYSLIMEGIGLLFLLGLTVCALTLAGNAQFALALGPVQVGRDSGDASRAGAPAVASGAGRAEPLHRRTILRCSAEEQEREREALALRR